MNDPWFCIENRIREMADLIQVVVLDCDGNKLRRPDGTWETMEIDRTSLGEAFQNASNENIAVQQLPNQPGSVAVVLYDEVEPEKVSWSRASVLVLIECYKKNKGKLRSGKHKKKHIWQEIVNVIQEETGQLFTIFQVQTKWKNITRKFREVIDHNSKPGNPVKSCNYFAELQEVYKHKPNLKSEDDEAFEAFCADDGSGESGDERGAENGGGGGGGSPMEEEEDAITSGNGRSSILKWSRESVLVLIDCYKSNASKFSSPKHKKKHIWQEIADVISEEAGQVFSWSQVEAKWKNLTKKYRDAVEHNVSSSANSTKTCSYFDELHELYRGRPSIKPEAMATGDSFAPEDGSTESGDDTMATNGGRGGASSRVDVKVPYSLHSVGLKQKWRRESVLVLIACYENNKDKFKSALHKKKHIWQDIARVINDETSQLFTWFQVEGKWKNLTKKYRDITDHNRVPGNRKRSCSFYAELKQVYDYKPSGKCKSSPAANNDEDSAESTYEIADSDVKTPTTSRSVITRKRRRSSESPQDRVLQTLCKMHEENKVLAAERMAAQKAMHEEKLVMFGQFLDVLKAATVHRNN